MSDVDTNTDTEADPFPRTFWCDSCGIEFHDSTAECWWSTVYGSCPICGETCMRDAEDDVEVDTNE